MAAVLAVNLHFAYRFSRGESVLPVPPEVQKMARIALLAGAVLVIVVVSIVFGAVLQGRWETFLVFFNRVSFGVADPQFGRDMGFHIATMPVLHLVQGWLMGMVIATAVVVGVFYFAVFTTRGVAFVLTPRIRGHLAILGALLMVTIAAAHYLDIFELVFSGRGAAPGAGYTDVNARIPVLWPAGRHRPGVLGGVRRQPLLRRPAHDDRLLLPVGGAGYSGRGDLPDGVPAVQGQPQRVRAGGEVHRQGRRGHGGSLQPGPDRREAVPLQPQRHPGKRPEQPGDHQQHQAVGPPPPAGHLQP